jgi:hypothetical protein
MQAGIFRVGKKAFQIVAFDLAGGQFLPRIRGLCAKFRIRLAHGIDVPAQGEKSDGPQNSDKAGAHDETPVRLQGVGGEIELYPHP